MIASATSSGLPARPSGVFEAASLMRSALTGFRMHRCVDHAGAHGIDPDAVAHDFGGETHGHGVDRSLRSTVVDEPARRAGESADRRNVDDAAALAAVLGRHALDRLAAGDENAGGVHGEDIHRLLERVVLDRPQRRRIDRRIVDEPGHRTESPVGFREQANDVRLGAHVRRNRDGAAAGGCHLRHDVFGQRLRAEIVDDDARARGAEQPRRRRADPAAGARNDDHIRHGISDRPRGPRAGNNGTGRWQA